jgi:steroid delta-isomerase-like uncharacterized protein
MAISQVGTLFDGWAAAWSSQDIDRILTLCTDDCIYEDVTMSAVSRGKSEIRTFAGAVFGAFPDFKIEMTTGFVAGDRAAAEWTMSGTHKGDLPNLPATGKRFSIRGATICELRDGRIKRVSDYWDMVTFLKQIGLMA